MTTSPTLIQRAAELVIAFGLEHTGLSANDVFDAALDSGLIVCWSVPSEGIYQSQIELFARRCTEGILKTRIYVNSQGFGVVHAKQVCALYARIVDLAERI